MQNKEIYYWYIRQCFTSFRQKNPNLLASVFCPTSDTNSTKLSQFTVKATAKSSYFTKTVLVIWERTFKDVKLNGNAFWHAQDRQTKSASTSIIWLDLNVQPFYTKSHAIFQRHHGITCQSTVTWLFLFRPPNRSWRWLGSWGKLVQPWHKDF